MAEIARLEVLGADGTWEAVARGTPDHVAGVALRRGLAWPLLDAQGRHVGQYHARIVTEEAPCA